MSIIELDWRSEAFEYSNQKHSLSLSIDLPFLPASAEIQFYKSELHSAYFLEKFYNSTLPAIFILFIGQYGRRTTLT